MDDDIFDEEDDTIIGDRSFKRMRGSLFKDGFREGVSEGQERFLQRGFNEGFTSATRASFELAKLRGTLSAIIGQGLTGDKLISNDLRQKIEELLEDVAGTEEKWVKSRVTPGDHKTTTDPITEEKCDETQWGDTLSPTSDLNLAEEGGCTGQKGTCNSALNADATSGQPTGKTCQNVDGEKKPCCRASRSNADEVMVEITNYKRTLKSLLEGHSLQCVLDT